METPGRIIGEYMKNYLQMVTSGFMNFIKSFAAISFIIYSIMYLVPGDIKFSPELKWPVSFFNWFFNLIFLRMDLSEIWARYFRTFALVFGALGISFVIVLLLLLIKRFCGGLLTNLLLILLNITSGFHVIVIGVVYYLLTHKTGLSFGVFLILAFGNGSLAEMFNTFESELNKILKREYVLAGVAWGHSILNFPKRELFITCLELLSARLPILISSTIMIERIFTIKGLSYTIYDCIIEKSQSNFELLITSTMMISATIILMNIIIEKMRYLLDPRVSHASD